MEGNLNTNDKLHLVAVGPVLYQWLKTIFYIEAMMYLLHIYTKKINLEEIGFVNKSCKFPEQPIILPHAYHLSLLTSLICL